jgi:hypothetical protein
MTLVPRRFCEVCGRLLIDGRCADHGLEPIACEATNAAGDVCSLVPPHRCPHRTADGRDFGAEQSDAELGAIIRAAFTRHNAQPGCQVELESVEAAEVSGVIGPGVVELRVEFRSKLKPGVSR